MSKLVKAVNHTPGTVHEQGGGVPGDFPVGGRHLGGISFEELTRTVSSLIDEGDRRSRKQPESVFSLSAEQKERAKGLGFPSERIIALERVTYLSIETLKKIIDQERLLPKAMDYMNSIAGSFASKKTLVIEDKDIPKTELEILIALIFSEENIEYGIPYIMSYFLGFLDSSLEEQTINVRLLTGLLDFWRKIGGEHKSFGRVPMEYTTEMEVFKCYTAYFDKEWYFTVPLINNKGNPSSEDYKVIGMHKIPDTFARIGMHYGSPEDIALDIAHYETIYVLGGEIYKYLRPAAKGLRNFIIKHQEFLGKPGNTPWHELKTGEERAWQGAKMLLSQIQAKATSQNVSQLPKKLHPKPSKSKVSSMTPANISTQTSQSPIIPQKQVEDVSSILRVHYSSPILREPILKDALCMRTQERNINTVSLSASSFCDNFPEGAYLCIKEGTNNWRVQKYGVNDIVIFDLISPGKTKEILFCFVSENEIPSKSLECTRISISRPKERIDKSHIQDIAKTFPIVVHNVISTPASISLPVTVQNPQNQDSPTSAFILEIIDSLNTLNISRENPNTLHVHLPGRNDFLLAYNLGKKEFLQMRLPEGVMGVELFDLVGGEMEGQINIYLSEELHSLCLGALVLEERQTRIFLSYFPGFDSRDEVLAECRIHGYASGAALLGKKHISRLQSLQSEFLKAHIGLSIEKVGMEMKLSIGLQSIGKKIVILSRTSTPYFSLENEASLSEVEKRLAKSMFLLVSILGKLLLDPPKSQKKTSTRKGNPDTEVLSPEQILDIIEGRYKPKTFSIDSLSREEIDRLKATIERFDDGRGRLFVSGGFSDTHGYYRCHVEGDKGWNLSPDDFIVLTDEKISSVPKGRTGQHYVYDMLQENERLKKYFILKMIATTKSLSVGKPVTFRGKRPFSNGLGEYFTKFWETVPESAKEEFMNQVAAEGGKARNGLSFNYMGNEEEIFLFQSFLDGIRKEKIPLIYSRPQIISFEELQEYKKTLGTQNLED